MTETVETYNGWKNYPTWAVNLWIGNDEGLYNYWRERAEEARSNDFPAGTREGTPRLYLADTLKEETREAAADAVGSASMFSDLLGYALDSVDWLEIADALLEA